MGAVDPSCAQKLPLWHPALTTLAEAPDALQALRSPDSNPPFTIALLAAVTVRPTVVECVALAPVPVTVSVYVPAAAVPALTSSVDEPPAVIDGGFSEALAPEGTPDTDRFTVCAEPLVTAVEIVELPLAL